jgi:hypothetical protein
MSIARKAFLGMALVLCASLAFAESVRVKAVNANLRSSPVSTAKIIGKVKQGKMLEVIVVSGLWTRVTDGTVTGWINNSVIERVAEAPAAPASQPASSSPASSNRSASSSSRPPAHRASSSDDKTLNFAVHGSLQNNTGGLGVGGRVLFTPSASLPDLRIMGGVEIFPVRSNDAPTLLDITANGVYVFRNLSPDIQPYVGAGLVHGRVSGASGTDLDIMGGVLYKKRFFGDVRIILEEGTGLILSAGVQF